MNSDYLKCNCFNERKTCINTCVCGTVLTSFYLKFSRNDLFCWSPHSFLHTCIFYNLVDSAECRAHVVMLLQTQRSFSLPVTPSILDRCHSLSFFKFLFQAFLEHAHNLPSLSGLTSRCLHAASPHGLCLWIVGVCVWVRHSKSGRLDQTVWPKIRIVTFLATNILSRISGCSRVLLVKCVHSPCFTEHWVFVMSCT